MDYFRVVLTSLFSITALFLITKLLGYRQMSQLSLFDYINGITIGSIAAELANSEGSEFWKWTITIAVYGAITLLLSWATDHSIILRRFITGKSIPLYENGQLLDQNFRKAKLDLNEFLMQCRIKGYFDLSQLETVLFEPNGSLSILPASPYRPATPFDLDRAVARETLDFNIILAGKVMHENLAAAGKDESWLAQQLTQQGCSEQDIFLAIYDPVQDAVQFYRKSGGKQDDQLE